MKRYCLFLVLLACPIVAWSKSYRIDEGPMQIGSAVVSVQKLGSGLLFGGNSQVRGAFQWRDRLRVGLHGQALTYRLAGAVEGRPVHIHVRFGSTRIQEIIHRGNETRRLSWPRPARPVYVIDNNLIDGFQVLVDQVNYSQPIAQRFLVFTPQVAVFSHLTLTPVGVGVLKRGSTNFMTHRLQGLLKIGTTRIPLSLWVQTRTHEIVELKQGPIRFLLGARRPGSTPKKLAQWLQDKQACLTSTTIHVHTTGVVLAGILSRPRRPGLVPAILLLPGSGPVDENGNAAGILEDDLYEQLADTLSCRGYAVLRYSKLGIPPSTGDANRVTLATYAQNVRDLVTFLRHEPGINPRQIVLMGHSEGGLIALDAAPNLGVRAMVLLESPGLPLERVLESQIAMQARLRGARPRQVFQTEGRLKAALRAIRATPGYRLRLQGPLRANSYARLFAHAAGLLRSELVQDPVLLIKRLRQLPVLIIQGKDDIQVLPQNGQTLATADPSATFIEIPHLTHDLVSCHGPLLGCALPLPGTLLDRTLMRHLVRWLGRIAPVSAERPSTRFPKVPQQL
ncbi:MAG: alpha/beta hydrolase family protein [Gammaproteobacteria bacterium]